MVLSLKKIHPLLFFYCLLMGSRIAMASPLSDTVDIHHESRTPACQTCHQAPSDQPLSTTKVPGCVSCHAAITPTKNRFAAPQGQTTSPAASSIMLAAAEEQPAKVDTPRPLAIPQYYDTSRIGAQPNEMVRVPAGKFMMGTDTRMSDEGPQHTVYLPTYWIDKYEVTNLQFQQFIDAAGKRAPDHFTNRTFPAGKADHPVTFVSWHDANAYCSWAGKRLPTDKEWEKAARGTDGRMFPWGDEFDINQVNTPVRWERLKEKGDTTPAGAFPGGASPYGALDMSGNVWEWTSSWYTAYPGNKKTSENYGEIYKTLKGGSWWDCSFYKCGISAPVFNRAFFNTKVKNASFGFRCAKDDK